MPLTGAATRPRTSDSVAALAHAALMDELRTWPKPGLVSPADRGSHRDMDYACLARSADAIRPFLAELARAGERGAGLEELRRIGLAAEGARGYAPGSGEDRAAVDALWGETI